ncbi:6-pyruvoyl trahydropterin synthase family protein [Desulfovibrio inopinatus]|uniref:6-pyruvoyl trahydropterin synthase family protein n=1 Tax=Desulfovibrio inopinatus TaxID=102109 RepID=UPI0003F85E2F|nr:6-carboxytetrahydropterin synthase [Desulfovibrio inopinatus]
MKRPAIKKGIFTLTVESDFSAGHALRNYEGACESMHGHNFLVEATVEGETLQPDTEILLDFKELKFVLGNVLSKLDHKVLNDVGYFRSHNPSSENLARFIYWELGKLLDNHPVSLVSVSVSENKGKKATYREIVCDSSSNE